MARLMVRVRAKTLTHKTLTGKTLMVAGAVAVKGRAVSNIATHLKKCFVAGTQQAGQTLRKASKITGGVSSKHKTVVAAFILLGQAAA